MSITKLTPKPSAKLPEVLFYKRPIKSVMSPPQEEFVAFSTKGDKNWGEIVLHKSKLQHRKDYEGDTLAIDFISSNDRQKGLGSAMIDFAKNLSKKNGCNGYLVLRADSSIDKHHVPHIFYRKQGFTTLDNKLDRKLDSFIKDNKQATSNDFKTQLMYYPAPQKKPSLVERLKNWVLTKVGFLLKVNVD